MNSIGDKVLDYKAIGQRIRKYRKLRNFSQEELAEKINISNTHMSHIETGSTKLSLPVLVEISEVLNVKTDTLLSDENNDTDHSKTIQLLQLAIESLR